MGDGIPIIISMFSFFALTSFILLTRLQKPVVEMLPLLVVDNKHQSTELTSRPTLRNRQIFKGKPALDCWCGYGHDGGFSRTSATPTPIMYPTAFDKELQWGATFSFSDSFGERVHLCIVILLYAL